MTRELRGGGSRTAPTEVIGAGIRMAMAVFLWLARHWLALANTLFLGVVAVSAAVPWMMAGGLTWAAGPLFASYRLICHQLPSRSFFLFGYQMAMCERNVAIYGSMALAGLTFALLRDRLRPLPWRWYLLALLPIAVDGFTQLLELRESTWELRLITGALFGAATIAAAYPRLDFFARDLLDECEVRGAKDGIASFALRTSHLALRTGNEVPDETS